MGVFFTFYDFPAKDRIHIPTTIHSDGVRLFQGTTPHKTNQVLRFSNGYINDGVQTRLGHRGSLQTTQRAHSHHPESY
jgi:hypothetical protein